MIFRVFLRCSEGFLSGGYAVGWAFQAVARALLFLKCSVFFFFLCAAVKLLGYFE